MVRLNIVLSEDLKQQLEARASESGHASVEDYVTTLILADANGASADYGAPAGQVVHTQAQLEQMLLERLVSPTGGHERGGLGRIAPQGRRAAGLVKRVVRRERVSTGGMR